MKITAQYDNLLESSKYYQRAIMITVAYIQVGGLYEAVQDGHLLKAYVSAILAILLLIFFMFYVRLCEKEKNEGPFVATFHYELKENDHVD